MKKAKRIRFLVSVDVVAAMRLRRYAKQHGMTRSSLVRGIVADWLCPPLGFGDKTGARAAVGS